MYLIGQSYPMNSPNFNSNVTLLIVIFIKLWLLHNLTLEFARNIIQRDQKPPNWVRAMNLIYFRSRTFRTRIRDRIQGDRGGCGPGLGWFRFQKFPGWLAATVAAYCPDRKLEHTISSQRNPGPWPPRSPCRIPCNWMKFFLYTYAFPPTDINCI